MSNFTILVSGLVGLVVGSLLTVVVHRVPDGESIVRPGSRCPACGAQIRSVDNVPVLSYILRRGRCRSCSARISLRYPLLELLTGGMFCALAARLELRWSVPAFCVLAAALIALSVIDVACMRLPSSIVYVAVVIGVPLLVLASAESHLWTSLLDAAIGGAVAFGFFFFLYLAAPGGIGFGDVRLAGLCGMFLGWLGFRIALAGLLASFITGGAVGLALLATHGAGRKSRIPFGPFLAAGTLIAVFLPSTVIRLWLG